MTSENKSNHPKTSCQFYDKEIRGCVALKELYCKQTNCPFYKPKPVK